MIRKLPYENSLIKLLTREYASPQYIWVVGNASHICLHWEVTNYFEISTISCKYYSNIPYWVTSFVNPKTSSVFAVMSVGTQTVDPELLSDIYKRRIVDTTQFSEYGNNFKNHSTMIFVNTVEQLPESVRLFGYYEIDNDNLRPIVEVLC